MSILSDAAGGLQVKAAVAAVLVGLVLATGVGLYLYVESLHGQITTAQEQKQQAEDDLKKVEENNAILKGNFDVLIDNNKRVVDASNETLKSARQLIADRSASEKAITQLAAESMNDKKKIDDLSNQLSSLLKDPKNDGPTAPVLKETVRNIQNARSQR
jgi:uncharacterized protein HemX